MLSICHSKVTYSYFDVLIPISNLLFLANRLEKRFKNVQKSSIISGLQQLFAVDL